MYTFRHLEEQVIDAGGLLPVTMEGLRDIVGAGKLGSHVRDAISNGLRQRSLVVLGGRLPNDQRDTVWLIAKNSPGGELLLECLDLIAQARCSRPSGEAA